MSLYRRMVSRTPLSKTRLKLGSSMHVLHWWKCLDVVTDTVLGLAEVCASVRDGNVPDILLVKFLGPVEYVVDDVETTGTGKTVGHLLKDKPTRDKLKRNKSKFVEQVVSVDDNVVASVAVAPIPWGLGSFRQKALRLLR